MLETEAFPLSLSVFDSDRDGDLDVAVGGASPPELNLFLQTLPGVFAPDPVVIDVSPPFNPLASSIADMDGDGDPDIVTADANGLRIFWGDH